jgi:hypothetical protein
MNEHDRIQNEHTIPYLLEPKHALIPLDRFVPVRHGDGDVVDDVVVNLGETGLVRDDFLDA